MAEPINFEGANTHALPPPDREDEIGELHCFRNGAAVVSAWRLSDAERESGIVYVAVMSGPVVIPTYVGDEKTCAAVVADTGRIWR